ncbi:MAG: hypothetical protein D6711_08610 [Chloroflexi bacterium]|nr:MAG: hypothetical protein D6711_08610 [Chloroflexota bacterium]
MSMRVKTAGEAKLHKLLNELPSKDFYFCIEPTLNSESNTYHPDAIVACWDYGVVVIEIKDWKTIIEGDQDNITIKDAAGNKKILSNPQHALRNYAITLARLLEEQPDLIVKYKERDSLVLPWHSMLIFTNIADNYVQNYLVREGILPKGVAFGSNVLNSPQAFQNALKNLPWRYQLSQPLTERQKSAVRKVMKPSLKVGDYGVLSPLQEFLSEEALNVSENATVRLVRGVAGSGKSLVLVRRVQYLRQHYPEKKILVLSYNDKLAQDLTQRINDPNVDVMTFHKLCVRIIKDKGNWQSPKKLKGWLQHHMQEAIEAAGLTIDFVDEEITWRKDVGLFNNDSYLTVERKGRGSALQLTQRKVINDIFSQYQAHQEKLRERQQVWYDWEDVPWIAFDKLDEKKKNSYRRAYDVILLDEAQDFAPSWIKVIKRVIKKDGSLFICDDPTQSLFKKFSWQEKGIPVRGRTRILRVPYRSTREISSAAHSLIQSDPVFSQSSDIIKPILETDELESGKIPRFVILPDKDTEVLFIYNEVSRMLQQGIAPSDIAILYHDYKDKDYWLEHEKLDINIIRYGQMKGLEFRIVILPFVGSLFEEHGKPGSEEFIRDRKIDLFTAMSRARQVLIMSHHEHFPTVLKCIEPHVYVESIDLDDL